MVTLSIQTKVTIDDFVEAAEQLQTAELEKLAQRLLQIYARRKAPNLPRREAELLEAIAQSGSFEQQTRYHQLNQELEHRTLTQEEQHELRELIGLSEAQTAQRLALLIELSQLRRVSLSTLMKQLQIKAPGVV
jgi:SpoVK/Ycf46/Vps4 family AAA+-type ATPase